MARRREAVDIRADFGDHRLRHHSADGGDGRGTLNDGVHRAEQDLKTSVDVPQPFLDRFGICVRCSRNKNGGAPVQCPSAPPATARVGPQQPRRAREQLVGARLALNETPENRTPTHAGQIADEAGDLQIRVLQSLLQAKTVLRHLPHELLAGAR